MVRHYAQYTTHRFRIEAGCVGIKYGYLLRIVTDDPQSHIVQLCLGQVVLPRQTVRIKCMTLCLHFVFVGSQLSNQF